jgi:hypothetical protein
MKMFNILFDVSYQSVRSGDVEISAGHSFEKVLNITNKFNPQDII